MGTARAHHWSRWGLAAIGVFPLLSISALAAGIGQPVPWQMDRQVAVTAEAAELHTFEVYLHWLAFVISLFVLGLIVYCIFKFNEKKNPVPSRTTHNTVIEIAWTVIPVLILVAIAIPSFRMLRTQLITPTADLTIKVTGHAWYWTYDYPAVGDQPAINFDANPDDSKEPKLLAVDNEMVVPVNKVVNLQVTSDDVIHAWTISSFAGKIDAVPGRLNQMWFKADREGIYYGQCSELCGLNHAKMPIAVKVVSDQEFAEWRKSKQASNGTGSKLASIK